ncbi:hypothetical protein Tsubulata_022288 [Turnera subulata]|uniref:Uncharacterized protein n=1 Tax=Turnera subulata TaxID=218843 RepID=A0A9Q0JRB8_9ROSI|nr:hypothetical protein Tsubulata_022288 [Turnera subulata]
MHSKTRSVLHRQSPTRAEATYLRFLKPGALAQLRDSRISARSHRVHSLPQQISPQPSQPLLADNPISADDFPCFSPRMYGPRCPQRKKLVAAKAVLFLPSSPVSDLPDPVISVLGSDSALVAH